MKSVKDYARQIGELPPMPEYITIKGPHLNDAIGAGNQTITIYEFDESKYPEAWKSIFRELDAFKGVPGFTFSTEILAKGNA